MAEADKYFGKYRGIVVDNLDPQARRNIKVLVPEIITSASWAMPCFPCGFNDFSTLAIPPIGADVWIEFERGDASNPIWTGSFSRDRIDVSAGAHLAPPADDQNFGTTTNGNALTASELPGPAGEIVLRSASGAIISMNDDGITIDNGKGASITLQGPAVSINNHALTII